MALRDFVEARAKYREGILKGEFPSHKEVVGPQLETASFKGDPTKPNSVIRSGVIQQGADFIAGYQRAQDLRNMTHADLRQAYRDNAAHQETYEKSRQSRFEKGLL